ncbi:holin family protein [Paenibacillus sp. N3.4]|uniref:phage holin family protein n=1 Tax=Paenibacillus sp. N3.4 TaxID=2603222 RepID=UPI0011C99641|nr:phage holin family protein [Paenibacillus sp. N3.4]TXK82617.1 phage holin family protein [Paenibacillus sp. N3.4]
MDVRLVAAHLFTAAAGATGKEVTYGGVFAVVGTFIAAAIGGWDVAFQFLAYMMVADYITGVLGAIKNKRLNSDVMFWGGIRKGVVMLVVCLAVKLDLIASQIVGGQAPVFRTLAICFYVGREGLSLIENSGVLGVPWPPAMKERLLQLRQKGEEKK